MPNDKDTCPGCGGTHEGPFSRELVDLWRRIQNAEDEDERFELMIRLSEVFVSDISDTDEEIDEDMHGLIANVMESRLDFEKHSLVLARVLLRTLPHHVPEEDLPATKSPQPGKSKLN